MSSQPWTATAAICLSGHVIHWIVTTQEAEAEMQPYCSLCGGAVKTRCAACGYALGATGHLGDRPRDTTYTALDYCAGYGQPHPWLSREGALDGLILAVRGDASLRQAERLAAVQQLEALKALDPNDLGGESEQRLWAALKSKAGPVWKDAGVQNLLHQVVPHVFKLLS